MEKWRRRKNGLKTQITMLSKMFKLRHFEKVIPHDKWPFLGLKASWEHDTQPYFKFYIEKGMILIYPMMLEMWIFRDE
jgi:hypothetical protein